MSRRSRRQSDATVTLFPFLAVLICTMGSLIVLLVVVVQQAGREVMLCVRTATVRRASAGAVHSRVGPVRAGLGAEVVIGEPEHSAVVGGSIPVGVIDIDIRDVPGERLEQF